jgi:hypothetical protein
MKNWIYTKVKSLIAISSLGALLAAQTVLATPSYPSLIPNGNSFSCATCHPGGSPPALNPFGQDFSATHTWSPTLAAKDSDGDGFSNGVELGDPNGTWTPGSANPAGPVFNPGDPASHPTATATKPAITTQPASRTVTAGASVTLSVVASGTAPLSYQWAKGGANIAGATSATLSLSAVTSANAGSYTVTVSNSAGSVTSAAAVLTVNPATPPPPVTLAVSLTGPANGATYTAPADVALDATVSATVSAVAFFDGTNLIGSVTTAPYSMIASNLAVGDHVITAAATGASASATSAPVTITVVAAPVPGSQPPVVSMVLPRDGAKYTGSQNVLLMATATASGSAVTKVEFFSGATSLGVGTLLTQGEDGEDSPVVPRGTALYGLMWSRVPGGQHVLTVKATDALGATSTSAPIHISVSQRGRTQPRGH